MRQSPWGSFCPPSLIVSGTFWHLLAPFGTFWHLLAPFGTLFRGGARKTGKKLKYRRWEMGPWDGSAEASPHRVWVFHRCWCYGIGGHGVHVSLGWEMEDWRWERAGTARQSRRAGPTGFGFSAVCFARWRAG
jgi:hypothetical protein